MHRLEEIYTSTNVKLLQHVDRLKEIYETKMIRPITLQIAPTDDCNLDCSYCSVKFRAQNEIPFARLTKTIDMFISVGILSAEVTGGGDPVLYPQINELIEYLVDKGIEVGVITNGLALRKKVRQDVLDRLTWLRISLSALDQGNLKNKKGKIPEIDIPSIRGSLGLSYVWNKESNIEKLELLSRYAEKYKVKFVRIVPNCLNVHEQEQYKNDILPVIKNYPRIFFQTKDYSVYRPCRMGWIKPYLNSDGFLYHCSANPLLEQRFHEEFRIGHMDEVIELWRHQAPLSIAKCEAGKCFYSEQNILLDALFTDVPHKNFV